MVALKKRVRKGGGTDADEGITLIRNDYVIDYHDYMCQTWRIMNGYTKLFADIVTSTIWQEPNDCRVLWITMLALKDKDNICRATVPALAKLASISLEDAEKYLGQFQSPDKYSRSQEHEGRRIAVAEGGWLILNGEKYQDKLSAADRREQVRVNVARHRAKKLARKQRYDPKGRTGLAPGEAMHLSGKIDGPK